MIARKAYGEIVETVHRDGDRFGGDGDDVCGFGQNDELALAGGGTESVHQRRFVQH